MGESEGAASAHSSVPARTRRRFFEWVTGAASALIAVGLGVPLVGYVVAPALKRRERPWVDLGPVEAVPPGVPTQLESQQTIQDGWYTTSVRKGVWVVREEADRVTCFAPTCTHLGCGFTWDPAAQVFRCPCHGSVFAKDGQVQAGPAPRPLDRLPSRVEQGRLQVVHQEFKAGLAKKVEL